MDNNSQFQPQAGQPFQPQSMGPDPFQGQFQNNFQPQNQPQPFGQNQFNQAQFSQPAGPQFSQPENTQGGQMSFGAPAMGPGSNSGGSIVESASSASSNNTEDSSKSISIIAVIVAILLGITTIVFLVLFLNTLSDKEAIASDIDTQVEQRVVEEKDKIVQKMETEFTERDKLPNKTFLTPDALGGVTFKYPKNWSAYVPDDGSKNNSFKAFFHPDTVSGIDDEDVVALRFEIKNEKYEAVIEDYKDKVEDGDLKLDLKVINGEQANVYTGKIEDEKIGIVAIFAIRDKTVIVQTDSKDVFEKDFNTIIESIKYTK